MTVDDSICLGDAGGNRDPDAPLESDVDSPLPSAPQYFQLRVHGRAIAAPTASGTSSALAVTAAAATLAGTARTAVQRSCKSMGAFHSVAHRSAGLGSTRSAPVRSSAAVGVSRLAASLVKTRSVSELGSGTAARPGHAARASSWLPPRGCAPQKFKIGVFVLP